MKKVLRIVSLALAAVMMFALTACAGANAAWVVDVDGEQIPTGLYLYYQFNSYQEAAAQVTDTETDVLKQRIEDQDASVWIYSKTIEKCKRQIAVEREFDKLGLALTEDQQAYIDNNTDYILSIYGTVFENNGIGKETVKNALTVDIKASAIFAKYYGAGGLEEVADATLKDYFVKNYAVAYAFGLGTSGQDEATVAKIKTSANNALNSLKSGKKVGETAAQFVKEANPDADVTEADSTDDNYKLTIRKDDAGMPETMRDAIFAAKADEPFLFDKEDLVYVIVRKDIASDTATYDNMKSEILQAIKGQEFTDKITALGKDLPTTENKDAVSYYSPKKIKNA